MSVLYVVEPGASVCRSGGQVRVIKEGRCLAEVELSQLESVVLLSSVDVTSAALCALLQAGVELAFMTARGKLLGQLTPPLARNLPLRRAQFQREQDPRFALGLSKAVLSAKIENQRQVFVRAAADQPGPQPEPEAAAAEMARTAAEIPAVTDPAALLGIEGRCAAIYWGAFGHLLIDAEVPFPGRKKRPPPDPVNAVLSFGYVLLTNLLTSALDAYGFDPFLGFCHAETYGNPSLALDLVEPFRAPVVDRTAVRMFNLKMLRAADFVPDDDGGVRMTQDALRKFFSEWEKQLGRLKVREAIAEQLAQLARVYRGEAEELSPWRWTAR